ncbi:MAG: putative LPS assembly protein LptD, partial [Candidatus Neomarinimicrobiota bacterium]|nr:putative LPS assembly protein LptD [Candidatus Neomarinimicrobiota bacterium]
MSIFRSFWVLLILITIVLGKDRLRLEKANVLESKTIDGKTVQYLSGDVIITKGDLTLTCQEGRNYEREEIANLFRGVTATKGTTILTCDTLKFFSREDRILSNGNPHVRDDDYDLVADSIIVFTEQDSGVAIGEVRLQQKGQTIYADRIEYEKTPDQDGVSYIAIGQVIIEDSSRTAICGRAHYERKKDITTLELEPEINENGRILNGEKIILTYKNEILETLHIPGKAHGITPVKGYKNTESDSLVIQDSIRFFDNMESSVLTGYFIDGILDSMRLEGMATSLYHIFEDSIYQGMNETTGDTITISFLNNDLDKLTVIGGSQGTYTPDKAGADMEFPIIYSADKINYRVPIEKTDLKGQAKIKHDNTDLEAGFVTVDWKSNMLSALPHADQDTVSEPLQPIIKEKGKDPMTGDRMTYNLKTRKGRMVKGTTRADDGYYTGHEIRNESKKVIFIQNSTYTTCDLDVPHFHFESTKMKIIQNDVVIARPIILHLAQIPIMGVPLGIFPHKGGTRHSGWIMPSYGESKYRGQYIDGLGFYWAPSDYWDSKFTMSMGDRQGLVFRINNNYRLRYKFSGNLNIRSQQFLIGSNNITDLGSSRKSALNIRWSHSQVLRNNQSFNANVTYSSSGDYNKKYGLTEADRMNQKAISNVSYSKRWIKSKNSISANLYSNQDLLINDKVNSTSPFYVNPTRAGTQLNIVNRTMPKISFRHGQSNLIPTIAKDKKWYNNITWNYGLNFTSKDRNYYESETYSINDSTTGFQWQKNDSGDPVPNDEQTQGWVHTTSINAPQKLFKYISVNPSINFRSVWLNESFDGVWNDNTVSFTKIAKKGFAARTTGSFSLSANTKLYGMFPIPLGPLKVIRHTASPSISFSYTPDFSKPIFGKNLGYIQTHIDTNGNETIFDRFSGTMAGNTPRSENKSMNFSLNNIFQGKMKKGDEEKKVDLLSWRMSSGYNFAAKEFQLTNLRSSLRSRVAGKLNLDLSITHDFYQYDPEKGRISEFNKDTNGMLAPRMTSARFSTGFRFSGKRWSETNVAGEDPDSLSAEDDLADTGLDNPVKSMRNTL